VLKRRKNHLLKKQNEEITRQKLAITKQHAKIHEQNILLEKSNAVKNRLFSIISHDLRSPLNSLQGIVSLMEIKTLSEAETKKISAMIALQVNTTVHLLDNLLSWAKNQMESLQTDPKEFDLQRAIADGIQLMQWSADSKNIKLKNEIERAIPVIADTAMIDIVIRNLIGNAIKFSKANDVVSVMAIPNGKFVKVIVKDTGQGISLENQSKIFNNGYTFTTPGTSNEKGTGLGLGLCKELVEKNGGKIWFESQPGKGSSFMFTIPK
jgi:two-component system sensor histidine kinase/response regulator